MRRVAIPVIAILSLASAARAEELLHKIFEAPLKGRKTAEVHVELGAAHVMLDGNAPAGKLYKATVDHDPDIKLKAQLSGDSLRLGTVGDQPLRRGTKNDWKIQLSPAVEWDIGFSVGATKGAIDLSGLKVRQLELEAGAAQMDIMWAEPNGVPLENASIQGGAARISVRGLGYARVRNLEVQGGAGSFALDFSGPLKGLARVKIETGAGTVDLDVPRNIGIRVVDKYIALAKVDWPDDLGTGDRPMTKNYAKGKGRIDLDLTAAIGRVRIRRI